MSEIILGIDLGTTNSLVAFSDERGPQVIPSPAGQRLCPSFVRVEPSGALSAGHAARANASLYPTETLFSVKRLMGRSFSDASAEAAFLPYRVVPRDSEGDDRPPGDRPAEIVVADRRVTPQEASAAILREMRQWAEAFLRKPVHKAVITVPAYFDDAQRQATRDAGRIAGLEVVRILNEPTAAALAYGLDRGEESTIAVYDFGGGTFDISILRLEGGVFRVLSTFGDTHLGGDDLDHEIVLRAEPGLRQFSGGELTPSLTQQLRAAAEAARVRLSTSADAVVAVPVDDGRTFEFPIRRDDLEAWIEPLVQRTIECCRRALADAGKKPVEIEQVVMVGGASYTPLVRKRVGELFQIEPYTALNPMEVVALGAGVQAGILQGVRRDILLLDVVPLSLGIETLGGAVAKIVMRGSHVPCHAMDGFTTSQDNQSSVKIHVVQGEREMVRDCRSLAQFVLNGIPPMPAGLPRVSVSFLVDASGILSVSAVEERSGAEAKVQVLPSYGLTRQEVSQMVRQAMLSARKDMDEHQLVDLVNRAEFDMHAIRKAMGIAGSRADDAMRRQIDSDMEAVLAARDARDLPGLVKALGQLDRNSKRLGELAIVASLEGAEPAAESASEAVANVAFVGGGQRVGQTPLVPGRSILDLARDAGVEIDHACGGVGACSTCHVWVRKGIASLTDPGDNEMDRIDEARDVRPESRLACQARVADASGEVECEIPAWNRNLVREEPHG